MTSRITMGHGSGGRVMASLIDTFRKGFRSDILDVELDSALLKMPPGMSEIAFTTDTFVVHPVEFPGGDIGKLAVCGTVNDLSVAGAVPGYLSCAFILEEGFDISILDRIVASMKYAADEAGVQIVTGDTKVVDKGHGDGIFINTAGIGFVPAGRRIGFDRIKAGDAVIINGTIGDHAMTIMSSRESLTFKSALKSDCAPLNGLVADLFAAGVDVRFMRDVTRGGVSSVLNEVTAKISMNIELIEEAIPVCDEVSGLSEILGIDPLYMANEGKLVAIVPAAEAEKTVETMKRNRYGAAAAIVGHVTASEGTPRLLLRTRFGGKRIVAHPYTEKLPRIC